jgi:putative addiction module killer protein
LLEYITEDGRNPFQEWIQNMHDAMVRGRIRIRLNRLRLGNFGDSKAVGDGVFELKIDIGPGYRVYYSKMESTVLLLLCGGDKSAQSKDISRAKTFLLDYKRRLK